MVNSFFHEYLKEFKFVQIEEITELSQRAALEKLLKSVANATYKNRIKILHEPKRKENYGSPDFMVFTDKSIIGYVENKRINENLDKTINSEQISKYRELSDNILLTNYIEFVWIKGSVIKRETLCYLTDFETIKFQPDNEKIEKVYKLIESFYSVAPQKIGNPKELSFALAKRCRNLKDYLLEELEKQNKGENQGLLFDLYDTFKHHVFNELSVSEFSDAFAQMLVYGLFLAKLNADTEVITLENVKRFIPSNFQLIKELVNFLDELDKTEYKETKWIIDETLSIMNNLDLYEISRQLSFGRKANENDNIETDPYIYFYETFLASYDKTLRKSKGVYYTPQPVVKFIIRLINDTLIEVFNIQSGLADYKKVTVLDFATGTGTFILEIFKLILEMIPAGDKGKKELMIKEHLLKNIFGFEYLIAPYTIAHLKLSQYLKENGYTFTDGERLQVYLTNTLEPVEKQIKIPFLPQLTKETQSAQNIKDKPILVITGNPPYYGHSKNNGKWIINKIKNYLVIDGEKIKERNSKWLQDDYVKFIRFAQDKIDKVDEGIVGIITNHSFLDNPTFRGMRYSLSKTFNLMYFFDLHGNAKKKEICPDGLKDENIFDIEQGVSITIMVKKPGLKQEFYHADLWGTRNHKYSICENGNIDNLSLQKFNLTPPFYLFKNQKLNQIDSYNNFWGLNEIFKSKGIGITTAHDQFVIDQDYNVVLSRFENFKKTPGEKTLLHSKFNVKDKNGWDILKGWDNLQNTNDVKQFITQINYRPFDIRYIFYEEKLIWRAVKDIMLNYKEGNIGLITGRAGQVVGSMQWNLVFITSFISDINIFYRGGGVSFPLYIIKNGEERHFFGVKEPEVIYNGVDLNGRYRKTENFTSKFRGFIDSKYAGKSPYSPETILGYIYAVLNSPAFRIKYAEFLKIDFPKIPFCDSSEQFERISHLGLDLINKHLLREIPAGSNYSNIGIYKGDGDNVVAKPEYNFGRQRLYINKTQYFNNIHDDIFNFYIGGYKILEKYLKDRKGRKLTLDEVTNIENIAKVITFTKKQMELIDSELKHWI